MFWRVSSLASGSAVEGILDKQQFTLEELLEEDELVQECKALNARLITYLKQKDTVEKLISYVIEPLKSWSSERQQQKLPFVACEVLCCEIDGIFDTIVSDTDLLSYFFSIFKQPRPLNSSRAGYFARVLASLLTKCSSPVMSFVKGQPWVFRKAVNHIEVFSVYESVQRMVGAADQNNANVPASDIQWLPGTTVLQHLTSKLTSESESDGRENAGKLLASIGRSRNSPLTNLLPSAQYLQPVLEKAFAAQQDIQLKQALHICIALLERRQPPESSNQGEEALRQSVERAAAATAELYSKLEGDTVEGICQHTDRLAALLDIPPERAQLETTYGVLRPPLGSARLAVIALVASLLTTGSSFAERAVIASDALPKCLQLVIQYPFNSTLHHLVHDIIGTILDRGPPSLLSHLFQHCNLLPWLLDIPDLVQPETLTTDDDSKTKRPPLRAGYMGHMTQIANRLHRAQEIRQEVAEFVQDDSQWQDYCTTHLATCNELQDVHRWSFGRPDPKFSKNNANESTDDIPLEGLSNGLSIQDSNGSHDRYGAFDNDDYNEEDHLLFQQNQGVGSVEFSDSDEEDENAVSSSNADGGGLSSFAVDSWEDTWDDSDTPVTQGANDGWGRLGSQLYQNHYDTHEHSGWSDDDDTDPDGIQPHTDEHDTSGDIDDDTVVLEDEHEPEDSDTVMVDALEALRLTEHMPHMSSPNMAQHSDENQRPQTANGSRPDTDISSSLANGNHALEGKDPSPSKGNRRRHHNRLMPLAEGSMWAMFAKSSQQGVSDSQHETHETAGNNSLVKSGLQSRLAEAAEDVSELKPEEAREETDSSFNSSQYWSMPLTIPDDIDDA